MLFAIRQAVEFVQRRFASLRTLPPPPHVRNRAVPRLEELEKRLNLGGFTVNTLFDAPVGGGVNADGTIKGMGTTITLRSAIIAANASNVASSISFAANLTGTMSLTGSLDNLNVNTTISGNLNSPITIDGAGKYQIFITNPQTTDEIDNLGIDHGEGGANSGGAIVNTGQLTLGNDRITYNHAASGGAIVNAHGAVLNLQDGTEVEYNTADGNGGGINNAGGQVNVYSGCYIADNNAKDGGGIYTASISVSDPAVVGITDNVFVNDNKASDAGGGIYVAAGTLDMGSSQLYENQVTGGAGQGGGIYMWTTSASVLLTGTVLEGNYAPTVGGGFFIQAGSLTLDSVTISGNNAPTDNGGAWVLAASAPTKEGTCNITDTLAQYTP